MIPTALVLGFAAGLCSARARAPAVAIAAISVTWAVLIAIGSADSAGDVWLAFWVAAANAGVGVLVGASVRFAAVGRSRPHSRT